MESEMKTKRTIRTMRRHGLDPKIIGFAGFTPNGKYIVKLAKYMRAERRLSDAIAAKHEGVVGRLCAGTTKQNVKAMTRFLTFEIPGAKS